MVKTIQFHCPKYTLFTPCVLICCQFLLGKTVAPREIEDSRSFSHEVTAAIFVYKTTNRRPCLCEKILWELNSFHMLKLSFIPSNCKAADKVTENDLFAGSTKCIMGDVKMVKHVFSNHS